MNKKPSYVYGSVQTGRARLGCRAHTGIKRCLAFHLIDTGLHEVVLPLEISDFCIFYLTGVG